MEYFWSHTGWEGADIHLKRLNSMPFKRDFPDLKISPGLYTIRGPRQIGKSSWLKMLLSKVVKRHGPEKAFFYSCENLEDFRELSELLNIYKNRSFIFLDEVTFVKDWHRPIKHLLDTDFIGTIFITGSNLLDLRGGSDRMPGREGGGQELELLPMDFLTFNKAWSDAGFQKIPRFELLKKYFHIGGFPLALAEAGEKGKNLRKAENIIEKWILSDISKAGYQVEYAKDLMSQIALTLTSQMSANKLASRTQIGSHHTVNDYLKLLEDMFTIRTLYSVDSNTGSFRFKKEKKYYFIDPLIARVSLRWIGLGLSELEDSQLAEMAAHEFLRNRSEHMGFLTSKPSGEVDFYAFKKWAIEVKWTEDIRNLSKAYKNLIVPFKRVWNQENIFLDLPNLAKKE